MQHKEGLRPLLFFKLSKLDFTSIEKILEKASNKNIIENKEDILGAIQKRILSSLDDFWAPIVIKEIQENKKKLLGKTSSDKYVNFFLKDSTHWQDYLSDIPKKYSQKFKIIKKIIENEIDAICLFIDRLIDDFSEIQDRFDLEGSQITNLNIGGSDRHQDGKTVVRVAFSDKKKILYKPKSSETDIFFEKYVETLNLCGDFSIKTAKQINRGKYSWHEYLEQETYSSSNDLKAFYRNFGAMLAICDSLNYTDGHSENFICTKEKKISLIDTETIFTNLSYFKMREVPFFFDLEFTGMIQSLNDKKSGTSALQDFNSISHYPVCPYVLNECTSDIQIRYKANKVNLERKSYPSSKKINLKKYVPEITEGMFYIYKKIKENSQKLNKLFSLYKNLQTRQIKRHTLYYTWLIHKALHPLNLDLNSFLDENLHFYQKSIITYERGKVLKGDIPLFYHDLESHNLYGEENTLIAKDYTDITSFDWYLKKQDSILNQKTFLEKRQKEILKILT